MKKYFSVLQGCPLFAGIEADQLEALLSCLGAGVRGYARGETILTQGDPAGRMGVVLSGTAEVMRTDYDGNRSLLAHLTAGELFAETFACAGLETMPVQVTAREKTEALVLDAKRMLYPCSSACGFHHRLIYNLTRILAQKNLRFQQKLEIMSRRTTREKLLAFLSMEAARAGSRRFTISFNRQELADYLEVDRSGLSVEISRLRKEGRLICKRSAFELTDGKITDG